MECPLVLHIPVSLQGKHLRRRMGMQPSSHEVCRVSAEEGCTSHLRQKVSEVFVLTEEWLVVAAAAAIDPGDST